MKVETTTGIIQVTDNQYAWLKAGGHFINMDNYPQALPCFNGTSVALMGLITTMPAGWTPENPKAETPASRRTRWILFVTIAVAIASLLILIF